jgi:MinD-like ATPase involved in chromosome partitioning or flagellar assembly
VSSKKEKLVITSWGNAEFGCEFAYRIAKETNKSVILLDIDLLAPKADLYLKIKKSPKKINDKGSGLDILMSSLDQNFLTGDIIENAAIKKDEVKNLRIITGSYKMDNWEYFKTENLIKIIEKSYQNVV